MKVKAEEVCDSGIRCKATTDLLCKANIEYFSSHEVARKSFSDKDKVKKLELLDVKTYIYIYIYIYIYRTSIASTQEKQKNREKSVPSRSNICNFEYDVISQL